MFNLEDYKEELVNCYPWGIDFSKEEITKRRSLLVDKDAYLLQIIANTEEFIYYLLTIMKEENNAMDNNFYFCIPLESDENTINNSSINLLLREDHPSDFLFYLENKEKLISMRLLHNFFKGFYMEWRRDDCGAYDEEEEMDNTESFWEFSISGPIEAFNQLYNKAQKLKGKELVNVLKRVRANKTK